ncbi:protein MGARP isoform 2-T2 [Geothlypis trichas]
MSLCRAASQALAARLSRAPAAAGRLTQRAPPRQMSSGSVPGPSRDSMMIYLLAGVAAFGGLFYAYRVVSSPRSKFVENTNILRERAEEQQSNPWASKGGAEEVAEVPGAEEATEEAEAAVEPAAQEGSAAAPAQEGPCGLSPAGDGASLAPQQSRAGEEPLQEAAAADSGADAGLELAENSEAAAGQVSEEEKTTEEVAEEP